MKRLIGIVSLLVLIACAHAESKSTFGLDLRSRMIMSSVATHPDADNQFFARYTDIRVRPSLYFQANDMLSAKVVMEIGDLKFGVKGEDTPAGYDGQLGTDGVNIETKHAYLDIKPNKDNAVRLGLMAYNDPQSLILDDDLAGVKYEGTFNQLSVGLGYYVTDDQGESSADKKTFSYGTSFLSANVGYKIDEKMSVDLTTLTQMKSENSEEYPGNQANSTQYWLAPRFVGDFGMVNADATFIYNGRSVTSYEKTTATESQSDGKDDGSGMAFSLKSNIKANEQLTVGVNFLFGSANDMEATTKKNDGYKPAMDDSYVDNGLEIITQGGNHDTGGNHNVGGRIFTSYGIMLPSLTVNYAVNDMVTVGGAFGMAMTLEDVKATIADKEVKDTSLGMEFGFNSKIKLYDKLNIAPYAAFFMPGKAYSYGLKNEDGLPTPSDKTDMQMKMGVAMNISF